MPPARPASLRRCFYTAAMMMASLPSTRALAPRLLRPRAPAPRLLSPSSPCVSQLRNAADRPRPRRDLITVCPARADDDDGAAVERGASDTTDETLSSGAVNDEVEAAQKAREKQRSRTSSGTGGGIWERIETGEARLDLTILWCQLLARAVFAEILVQARPRRDLHRSAALRAHASAALHPPCSASLRSATPPRLEPVSRAARARARPFRTRARLSPPAALLAASPRA